MEDIRRAEKYHACPQFSMVELEDEMENLFAWTCLISSYERGHFVIGKVKEYHE